MKLILISLVAVCLGTTIVRAVMNNGNSGKNQVNTRAGTNGMAQTQGGVISQNCQNQCTQPVGSDEHINCMESCKATHKGNTRTGSTGMNQGNNRAMNTGSNGGKNGNSGKNQGNTRAGTNGMAQTQGGVISQNCQNQCTQPVGSDEYVNCMKNCKAMHKGNTRTGSTVNQGNNRAMNTGSNRVNNSNSVMNQGTNRAGSNRMNNGNTGMNQGTTGMNQGNNRAMNTGSNGMGQTQWSGMNQNCQNQCAQPVGSPEHINCMKSCCEGACQGNLNNHNDCMTGCSGVSG